MLLINRYCSIDTHWRSSMDAVELGYSFTLKLLLEQDKTSEISDGKHLGGNETGCVYANVMMLTTVQTIQAVVAA